MSDENRKNIDDPNLPPDSPGQLNNSAQIKPIDELFYGLMEQRAERNKKHKSRIFIGLVLDWETVTSADCLYETSEVFYKSINPEWKTFEQKLKERYKPREVTEPTAKPSLLDQIANTSEPDSDAKSLLDALDAANKKPKTTSAGKKEIQAKKSLEAIWKVKVYIPEMMGFLPMLEASEVEEYHKMKKSPPPDNKNKAKLCYYERILSRIPAFYIRASDTPGFKILKAARIQFADQTFMNYGTFIGMN